MLNLCNTTTWRGHLTTIAAGAAMIWASCFPRSRSRNVNRSPAVAAISADDTEPSVADEIIDDEIYWDIVRKYSRKLLGLDSDVACRTLLTQLQEADGRGSSAAHTVRLFYNRVASGSCERWQGPLDLESIRQEIETLHQTVVPALLLRRVTSGLQRLEGEITFSIVSGSATLAAVLELPQKPTIYHLIEYNAKDVEPEFPWETVIDIICSEGEVQVLPLGYVSIPDHSDCNKQFIIAKDIIRPGYWLIHHPIRSYAYDVWGDELDQEAFEDAEGDEGWHEGAEIYDMALLSGYSLPDGRKFSLAKIPGRLRHGMELELLSDRGYQAYGGCRS